MFLFIFQDLADQWASEKNILMCAFQRLHSRNQEKKQIGTHEGFLVVNEYSILSKNNTDPKHDDNNDVEMEEDCDENDDEILEQNSAGSIYCSICKEIFLEARSLAKHIIKEHCSKGRFNKIEW